MVHRHAALVLLLMGGLAVWAADPPEPAAVAPAPVKDADWPQWRGPNRDGTSPERLPVINWPPRELWRQQTGIGYSSVAVSDGRAYTMGKTAGRERIFCFDALDGKLLWEHTYDLPAGPVGDTSSTPTVCGDDVYTYGCAGDLLCLDRKTGAVRWQKRVDPGGAYGAGSPLVSGGILLLNAGGGATAVRKDPPHDVLWGGSNRTGAGYASPVVYADGVATVAVVFAAQEIVGVDTATGTPLWRQPWESINHNIADPVLYGDRIFVSSKHAANYAGLFQIAGGKIEVVWANRNICNHTSSSVRRGDYLYGISERSSRLKCIDLKTGAEAWPLAAHYPMREGNIIMTADDRVIGLDLQGRLSVVRVSPAGCDASEGFVRADLRLDGECRGIPALAGGRLYCRSRNGTVVCVELAPRTPQ
jgi:outer membrane protein assembly factor BamB